MTSNSAGGNGLLMTEVRGECPEWSKADRKAAVTQIIPLYTHGKQKKQLRMSTLEINVLQQHKITPGSTPFSREQEPEATMSMGLSKPDSCVYSLQFLRDYIRLSSKQPLRVFITNSPEQNVICVIFELDLHF